jgi:hypothetical protein
MEPSNTMDTTLNGDDDCVVVHPLPLSYTSSSLNEPNKSRFDVVYRKLKGRYVDT